MNIGFFTCGLETPAARYRVRQFFPFFERHGISCALFYAYGSNYNRIAPSLLGTPYKLLTRLKRAGQMLLVANQFDAIFLQRTALPQTALPEIFASHLNSKIIFDFDDAIYLGNNGRESYLRNKTVQMMTRISHITIVGNHYLADRIKCPQKTEVIPTVIDSDLYTPGLTLQHDKIVVGWMGTSSNFDSVRSVLPAIREVLRKDRNVVFRIVSNQLLPDVAGWERVEQRIWTAEREIEDLRSFDIGIMPLLDNEVSKGKCGFKLILYMATGLPVVASSVGANLQIVEDGLNGYLVNSQVEWVDTLESLIQNRSARSQIGEGGRIRAESKYSVKAVLPQYLKVFEEVMSG